MRSMSIAAGALLVLMVSSCGSGGNGGWPTEGEINDTLNEYTRSVSGNWTGVVNGPNTLNLTFSLQQASNGQVTGSGTMKEGNAAAAVPITITGTYQRPVLTLVFHGMVYESQQVTGNTQGSYTTVGGIGSTLRLTAPGYTRDLQVLLQESLH